MKLRPIVILYWVITPGDEKSPTLPQGVMVACKFRQGIKSGNMSLDLSNLLLTASADRRYRGPPNRATQGWCAMDQGPDFRHYESFIGVAEECSFRKAAEKLHITQPALSGHIKVLEEWLGEAVFKRGPSGSELTEAGRNLLVYARHILHLRTHAKKASSRKHSAAEWPLRLGYSPFINHMLIEEALVGYTEIVPDGRINSSSDCTGHLIEMIEDGRLDAAIVTLPIFEHHLYNR